MLNLRETFLLLALHEDKGTILSAAATRLPYCLVGACLIELSLKKRIQVEKTIRVSDRTPTGDELLDEILQDLGKQEKEKSVLHWLYKLRGKVKTIKSQALEHLVDQGVLREEESTVLVFFPTIKYPLRDERVKQDVKRELNALVFRKEQSRNDSKELAALVYVSGLLPKVFDREDLKEARKLLKGISKENAITKAIGKTGYNQAY